MLNKLLKVFCAIILFYSINLSASGKTETVNINHVLVLGPIELKTPAFAEVEKDYSELIKFENVDVSEWMPAENEEFQFDKNTKLKWTKKILMNLNLPELEIQFMLPLMLMLTDL